MPLRILGALALALLLSARRRGVGAYRAAVYLPTVIPDVAFALIWLWIFNPLFGPVNLVLGRAGAADARLAGRRRHRAFPFVVMSLFQIGEGFVVLLAALRGHPARLLRRGRGRRRRPPQLVPVPHPAAAGCRGCVLLTFRDVIVVLPVHVHAVGAS